MEWNLKLTCQICIQSLIKKIHIPEVEQVHSLFLFLFYEQAEGEAELHVAVQELQAND